MKRALLYTGLAAVAVAGAAATVATTGRRHLEAARTDLAKAGYHPDEHVLGLGRNGRGTPALAVILPHDENRQLKATYGRDGWTPRALVEADGTLQPLPDHMQYPIENRLSLTTRLKRPVTD